MFSFKEGRRIARIKGGKRDKGFIYLTDENTTDTEASKEIIIKDGVLIPLPNKQVVEKIYVTAPSGSGKSTWTGNYMREYKKIFRDDPIYLFSSIDHDRALDKYDPERVELTEDIIQDPLTPEELQCSLVILDDTDTIRDRRMLITLQKLRDWLLEQGRHFNIRMLVTSHLLSNYQTTRRILNEATTVVVFPRSGSGTFHIKRFLKDYCGMGRREIKKFINLPSRWVSIYRSFPQYVLYEKGVYIPRTEDDE
jgi:hypothetical protein